MGLLGDVILIAGSGFAHAARWRVILRMLVGIACCLAFVGDASALDPTRTIAQLRHSRWTLGDGAPGNIRAIAQGRDGYLWLGTATGLYRFDGILFERIVPADPTPYRSPQITALLAARNGDIWVGYDFGGVSVVQGGVLKDANPWPPTGGVVRIVQGDDGAIWVTADSKGKLVLSRLWRGRWTRFGPRQGVPESDFGDILSTARGVYLAVSPGLLLLKPGATRFEDTGVPIERYSSLAQGRDGTMWRWHRNRIDSLGPNRRAYRTASVTTPYVREQSTFDRDGNLWITGQDAGLGRIAAPALLRPDTPGSVDLFTEAQGLTASLTLSMLEDREGNVWVGTESGLDRFSPSNIVQPARTEAIVSGFVGDARSDAIFVAGRSGVYRIGPSGTPMLIFAKTEIGVLCGTARRLLVVSMRGKYLLDIDEAGTLVRTTPIAGPLSVTCGVDATGGFWTGMDRVYRLVGTRLQPVAGAAGVTGPTVTRIRPDGSGGVVFGRVGQGVSRLRNGVQTQLWRSKDLVTGRTQTLVPIRGGLLVVGDQGLARFDGRHLVALTDRTYPFLAGLTGLIQTTDGSTWVIGATGIVRMRTSALDAAFAEPGRAIAFERFGYQEDFRARSNLVEANDIAQDSRGRLWFATNRGLAHIDPGHLSRNALPPVVQIRTLVVGGVDRPAAGGPIALPAGVNNVQIRYTALSLTNATANRFRYRMDGLDPSWIDAGTAREALYTNLGPGNYRFRVIAANNDGVWNREGAALSFTIAPRFYQTGWFLLLCTVCALGLIWLIYRRRLRILAERTRGRFEAQLAERERIARELHDTLLQGFQGLMLRFQSVVEQLPRGDRVRASLEGALERADDVLLDGRDRVRALRENMEPVALPTLLRRIAGDTVLPPLTWDLVVEGAVKPVCAPVADEIAQIVGEALANTVRHARAERVTIDIRSLSDKLVITVTDDGIGLPPEVRETGRRPGHYGFVGMRERADRMRGTLALHSDVDGGTRIRLTIPARIAYR